ncbi:hypothetical protein N183_14895 [Sinorhizobium sp. Sb3]|uniref:DNA/RNA non-specific endonuclease n=1 Tax=Sinorhizobium sp. Sb3 TaxID=1358417 RepID=UPI00071D7991|nr:DNA/RNA non-specific endonuclease [Sinorhizobium sp. Sb3]KSV81797.1 hypothetical protein N183_14895 [Sinorhizobium sp. Sb3]
MKLAELDLERFAPEAPSAGPIPADPPSATLVERRYRFLTADGQTATPLEQEALFGTNDLVEVSFLERCMLARTCVGRIRIRSGGRQGWATGFLIAPGLVLTNHHVFPAQDSVGSSRIGFDYWFDVAGQRPADPDEFELRPDLFYVSLKALDYAVVAIAEKSARGQDIRTRRFLRLIPESGKVKQDEFVTLLQHPDGAPMQVALRENKVIRANPNEEYLWYKADTAHGSSGSPVFNDSLQVVALHANGRIVRDANGRIALASGGWADNVDGLTETDVVWEANVGFRASRIAQDLVAQCRQQWPGRHSEIEAAMLGGDIMSSVIKAEEGEEAGVVEGGESGPSEEDFMADSGEGNGEKVSAVGSGGVVIPLQLHVTLSVAGVATTVGRTSSPELKSLESEALEMRMPVIYDGLPQRRGFQARFLDANRDVPAPKLTKAGDKVVAPLIDGSGTELRYQHFSVWMHSERRLALYTAANVDWRKRRKTVDGKPVTRASLAGWSADDKVAELWAADPRIETRYQLPDAFYTEDRAAFDKGHITRRDDVCWGKTFEDIQMANGDTFHVTNCSPQVKEFNQGKFGEENWGDLEDAIARITKEDAQAACIFAGPVFRGDDRWFRGKDDQGAARIQIPSRFWKIVVVKGQQDFEAYGFLLEQDVRKVTEEEFYVTDEWLAAWKPIPAIQELMRGWLDFGDIARCDKHSKAGEA